MELPLILRWFKFLYFIVVLCCTCIGLHWYFIYWYFDIIFLTWGRGCCDI